VRFNLIRNLSLSFFFSELLRVFGMVWRLRGRLEALIFYAKKVVFSNIF